MAKLYWDGVVVSSLTYAWSSYNVTNSGSLQLGVNLSGFPSIGYFNGKVADARILHRVLSVEEIQSLQSGVVVQAAQTETQQVDYVYDTQNRRIGKTVDTDGDGDVDLREGYVWSDFEKNVVLDFVDDDLDGTLESSEVARRYLWGTAVDELFAQENIDSLVSAVPEDVLWALTDNQGSVRDLAVYDEGPDTTSIDVHYSLDSFGNILSGDETATRYIYTAQEYDLHTGEWYYDRRWYSSFTGRFISEDFIFDDLQNTYRPFHNSPTNFTDPSGLSPLVDFDETSVTPSHSNPPQSSPATSMLDAVAGVELPPTLDNSLGLGSAVPREPPTPHMVTIRENRVGQRVQTLLYMSDGTIWCNGSQMKHYMDGWYIPKDTESYVAIGQMLPTEVQMRDAEMYEQGGIRLQFYLMVDGVSRNLINIDNHPRPAYEPRMIEDTRDGQAWAAFIANLSMAGASLVQAAGCKGWICFTGETPVLVDEAPALGTTSYATAEMPTSNHSHLATTTTILVGAAVAWEAIERRKLRRGRSAEDLREDRLADGDRDDEEDTNVEEPTWDATCSTAPLHLEDRDGIANMSLVTSEVRRHQVVDVSQRSRRSKSVVSRVRQAALAVGLCLLALLGAHTLWNRPATPPLATTQLTAAQSHDFASRKIADIRVGDRVVANNPEVETSSHTEVDPATWRLVRMEAILPWDDGTMDDFNIETLQPLDQIEAEGAEVGAWISAPLDLVEMGLPEDFKAQVIAVEPCPPIKDGDGRVVLTTVNHLNNQVLELTFDDGKGGLATVRPTRPHRFYSLTRNSWVASKDLEIGEQLIGVNGTPATLTRKTAVPGAHRVYNMTVEGEHVYHVAEIGLLAHNNYHGNRKLSTKPQHEYEVFKTSDGDVVKNGVSGAPLNQNGTSPRANRQVNKWNAEEGAGTYDARVVNQNVPTRTEVLKSEAARSDALRADGNSMSKHKRP